MMHLCIIFENASLPAENIFVLESCCTASLDNIIIQKKALSNISSKFVKNLHNNYKKDATILRRGCPRVSTSIKP
jgi:hypothetical protein